MNNNKATTFPTLLPLSFTVVLISTQAFAATKQLPQTDFSESVVSTANTASKGIRTAWYDGATTRYAHGVLGDAIEAGELYVKTANGKTVSLILDAQHVFEDIAPRLADMDGDGQDEVITIRSHQNKGGQIAVYGITASQPNQLSLVASTPYIGQSYRWLAPVGIADFNNDGAMDIAYIDRPHLAKILRVWSYAPTGLKQIAQKQGLTNHRIGDDFISGGVSLCDDLPAMLTVDSSWSRILKTSFTDGRLLSEDIGSYVSPASFNSALNCK